MTTNPPAERHKKETSRHVLFIQYMLPSSFTVAMLGIIIWIVSLIRLSRKLHDTPSASVGISIVAIPLFLLLLAIFWYTFLGIIRNQEEPPDEQGGSAGGKPGGTED